LDKTSNLFSFKANFLTQQGVVYKKSLYSNDELFLFQNILNPCQLGLLKAITPATYTAQVSNKLKDLQFHFSIFRKSSKFRVWDFQSSESCFVEAVWAIVLL